MFSLLLDNEINMSPVMLYSVYDLPTYAFYSNDIKLVKLIVIPSVGLISSFYTE